MGNNTENKGIGEVLDKEVNSQPEAVLGELEGDQSEVDESSNDSRKMVERDEQGRLKKGSVLNPLGKSVGTKDYATLYKEAILAIAKSQGVDAEAVEQDLIKSGLLRGIKGNFKFYQDVLDRIHGKPVSKVDMNIQGEMVQKVEIEFKDFEDENIETNTK